MSDVALRAAPGTTMAVFTGTLFLSAALMFMVQPMAGRMLLPLVGGTPAGWAVAMAFFQVTLLCGYLIAHVLSRFSARVHGALYLAALAAGWFFLPPVLQPPANGIQGAGATFLMLASTLAVPFAALSATSSTIQRLFSGTGHPSAKDPYFLYAASNLGSFTGLLSYPLLIEPALPLSAQAGAWQGGYAALFAAGLLCLALSGKGAAAVTSRMRLDGAGKIFILSFLPSALLLAVTTQITTDIFPAPMIWVIPLGLYLLTFVAAFARRQVVPQARLDALHLPLAATAVFFLLAFDAYLRGSWLSLVVQVAAFTVIAFACHTRLAAARPAGDSLTAYYLVIAAGGAAGGVLNAFVFPAVLDRLLEYPALLALSCLLHPAFRKAPGRAAPLLALGGVALYAGIVLGGASLLAPLLPDNVSPHSLCDAVLILALAAACRAPRAMPFAVLALLLFTEFLIPRPGMTSTRNFFGVVRVFNREMTVKGESLPARYMYHGTTTHGFQILDPRYETLPTAYFSDLGPAGNVFSIYNPRRVLVIGLGTGSMACYKNQDNAFTFIEIDPAVTAAAKDRFTYLRKCGNPEIIEGDGRLVLAGMKETFDLIVLDAFSSDAIPTHLLTVEAIRGYLDRLSPRGLLLFNITNRYFNLSAALAANARAAGLKSRLRIDAVPVRPYAAASVWTVMAPPAASLSPLDAMGWASFDPPSGTKPWTDDYTNLLSAIGPPRQ